MALEVSEEILAASEYFVSPRPDQGLVVFGRAWTRAEVESYDDDWSVTDYRQNGGYIYGDWASVGYPQGELGSNHITRCIPITRDAYVQAQAVNWDIDVVIMEVI